ncbi:hypothetical protein C8N38_10932 [Rhodovulum kholense]|uniref:Uncharacterized protein n=1 Tax=Rhodovulum kholense TaxID=453584 RepID=A0A8E2VIG2_9RHOB|nr:hypothetical protein C8N38_10932 [Rhodovulum kholense]
MRLRKSAPGRTRRDPKSRPRLPRWDRRGRRRQQPTHRSPRPPIASRPRHPAGPARSERWPSAVPWRGQRPPVGASRGLDGRHARRICRRRPRPHWSEPQPPQPAPARCRGRSGWRDRRRPGAAAALALLSPEGARGKRPMRSQFLCPSEARISGFRFATRPPNPFQVGRLQPRPAVCSGRPGSAAACRLPWPPIVRRPRWRRSRRPSGLCRPGRHLPARRVLSWPLSPPGAGARLAWRVRLPKRRHPAGEPSQAPVLQARREGRFRPRQRASPRRLRSRPARPRGRSPRRPPWRPPAVARPRGQRLQDPALHPWT